MNLNWALYRLGLTLTSLFGVLVICFFLIHLVPGDPVDSLLGENAASEDKAKLRHELGLDQPLTVQFATYLKSLLELNLGRSLHTRRAVSDDLRAHLPATIELGTAAILLALAWGLPLGVWAAVRTGTVLERLLETISLLGLSVPGIFIGPTLIYIFALRLDWFPISDRGGIEHLVLPAFSLAIPLGAAILKITRASMLEVLANDYMRTARAKGAGPMRLRFKHALANALMPVITIVGLQAGAVLTGTVVTETIFDWPGLGLLLYTGIQRRDYPVVQACVLTAALIYVLVNAASDVLYGLADPRVRRARS